MVRGEDAIGEAPSQTGALYQFLVESLSDHAVFALSRSGKIRSWNVGAQRTFGYSEAEVRDRSFDIIFTPEDVAAGAPALELAAAMEGSRIAQGRWHLRRDGSRFWGTNTIQTIKGADGSVIGFTKLVHDDTEQRTILDALSDSEEQLRLLVGSVSEYAIVSIDVGGRITSWNTGAQQLFGYREAEIIGTPVSGLFLNADRHSAIADEQLQAAAMNGSATYEGWVGRRNGTQFFASSKLCQLNGGRDNERRGFVLVAHDITERHFAVAGLQHRAYHDHLTNIPNRAAFHEYLQRAIAARKRHSSRVFAVLFIDLDNFKGLNDVLGHNAADTVLQYIAQRLTASVRDDDVVARLGGDEFAVLLNCVDGPQDAQEIAERIGVQMAIPLSVGGHAISVSASVGIAMCSDTHARPEDILYEADMAMYAAKGRGRAGAVTYTSALQSVSKPPTLHGQLRHALRRNELRVYYQPIVALTSRRVVGFEALVRWNHPERGLIAPQEFMPLAETSDLVIEVDRWVLREACMQIKEWQRRASVADRPYVSVNLSPEEFMHPDVVEHVRSVLAECGVTANSLHLEMTESTFMERSERMRRLLQEIQTMGVELHVDDFGTGYSSLATLAHMPVQGLKIDAMFVASMNSHSGLEIVRSIATLAHHLGLTAIAEGIRTEQHVRDLEQFGCQFGQGFLFSEPLDAAAATAYLRQNG